MQPAEKMPITTRHHAATVDHARGANDPDDLTSEVFLRVFTHLDQFTGDEGGFLGWIFTIARRVLIDEHRRTSRRPTTVEWNDPPPESLLGGDTETEALRTLENDDLTSILAKLTPDQRTATLEVKRDMERPRPMDRLLVGDVGYGKTEVALRAAFKAVQAGKQVAVLVPTTILAEQHGRTFRERLADPPEAAVHEALLDVPHRDLESCGGARLRDPGAHRPRPDHRDLPHIGRIHRFPRSHMTHPH